MEFVIYILAGAGVGLAVGLTGVGGGSLMTPLLILFGFPYNVAIGTDLLYAAITKSSGVFAHHKKKHINWRLVGTLALGSVPASIATSLFLSEIFTNSDEYKHLLIRSLGVMLVLTSAVLLFKKKLQDKALSSPGSVSQWIKRHTYPLTLIVGIALGVLVTLSSVGAGAFCAAILLLLYPALSGREVVGTDIAHAVPLTLIGGVGHFFLGNVDFVLLGCLLIGSIPAIHLGTHLSNRLPNRFMLPLLAAILMAVGIKFTLS